MPNDRKNIQEICRINPQMEIAMQNIFCNFETSRLHMKIINVVVHCYILLEERQIYFLMVLSQLPKTFEKIPFILSTENNLSSINL